MKESKNPYRIPRREMVVTFYGDRRAELEPIERVVQRLLDEEIKKVDHIHEDLLEQCFYHEPERDPKPYRGRRRSEDRK